MPHGVHGQGSGGFSLNAATPQARDADAELAVDGSMKIHIGHDGLVYLLESGRARSRIH